MARAGIGEGGAPAHMLQPRRNIYPCYSVIAQRVVVIHERLRHIYSQPTHRINDPLEAREIYLSVVLYWDAEIILDGGHRQARPAARYCKLVCLAMLEGRVDAPLAITGYGNPKVTWNCYHGGGLRLRVDMHNDLGVRPRVFLTWPVVQTDKEDVQ